jgi:hypothetical protein
MYKLAYVSGNNQDISSTLRQTINSINDSNGTIVQMVQSQSTSPGGYTIVTVTIIYT